MTEAAGPVASPGFDARGARK